MLGLGFVEIFVLLVLLAFLIFSYGNKNKRNLPPGPFSLPLLGNIFQLTGKAHLKLAQWAKQYGKIYKIQIGTNLVMVVNDVKLAKEMLSDSNFSSRPHIPILELFAGGNQGIVITNGSTWEEQRRWSLRKLKDYGLGKSSIEGIILDEVNEVIERLRNKNGEYIAVKRMFDLAILNSLWTLLNGQRLSQDDPKIRDVLDAFSVIIPAVAKSGLVFAPWLRLKYIFPSAQKMVENVADKVTSFAKNAVTAHFETHEPGAPRDFIDDDEYIDEIKKTRDSKSSFFQQNGRNNLEGTVCDVLRGGGETTSNSLTWMFIYLSQYPEIQKKVHAELDAIVGNSRSVSLSDKPNLPYLEAVINESLRHASLVSSGVEHAASADTTVSGYFIPKGAWIMTNIYYIHHDADVWGDPENFRPERFLSSDGRKFVRHESLIAFSTGRRQCLGEGQARASLFLFASNILQQFKIDKKEKSDPEPIDGLFLVPKEYHFSFNSRV